jgi:hypothetical protein
VLARPKSEKGLHRCNPWYEWCCWPESNWRPTDYESVALPTELQQHTEGCGLYLRPRIHGNAAAANTVSSAQPVARTSFVSHAILPANATIASSNNSSGTVAFSINDRFSRIHNPTTPAAPCNAAAGLAL